MTDIPTGATHRKDHVYYRKTPQGVYRWSPALGSWRFMEDGKARRELAKASRIL